MQCVRRVGSLLGTGLLAILAVTAIATATGWIHITPVLSGSMRGAFNPGDALLTQRVPLSSLRVGDVVDVKVAPQAGETSDQRVHRVVSLRHRGDDVVIRTKGDANAAIDPGKITLHGDQYVMRARIPYVGWIVDFKAANGMRLLIEAIALLSVVSVGQRLLQVTSHRPPRVRRGRSTPRNALAS